MKYAFRAELPDNVKLDFQVSTFAELPEAKKMAEGYLLEQLRMPEDSTVFDWRGQVVFVNQGVGERV